MLPTASAHRQAAQDLARLNENRNLLVQRLERVMVALALTLDAQAAAEERLGRLHDVAGTRRINRAAPPTESARLAQRYRDVIHAIDVINADVLNSEGARP